MHLAIGGSGTNPTLQLHRSTEETSAPPTLFFFFQDTNEVWLLTEPYSEIKRAKFLGDWTKSAINQPISSIYLKHPKRDARFQMHGPTSVCGHHMRRRSAWCTSLRSFEQTVPLITLLTFKENI